MKDFSVNNIIVTGQAPVLQGDIGIEPNQVPLNKDLGSLAYMDAPQIEDINVDTLELREMAAEISDTAVDVFVYDTRKDSDGGAWRSRTSHTSWYNEELNTATRGGRREFPAVAVIVAEAGKVTIYDGDDPDLPMWMVFEVNTDSKDIFINDSSSALTSIAALNGRIFAGSTRTSTTGNITGIDFVGDRGGMVYTLSSDLRIYNGGIGQRNDGLGNSYGSSNWFANGPIVNRNVNDVAMTVLPNAPIDADTGLPVPTIAVATDGGVSIIKDDGSVVDKVTTSSHVNQVQWMGPGRLVASAPNYYGVFDDPFVQESDHFVGYISDSVYNANPDNNHLYQVPNILSVLDDNSKLLTLNTRTIIASTSAGLNVHEMGEGAAANNNHGIATYITSEYNTGWMPGDIKLATLSDTKVEKVGVDESTELISNNKFGSGTEPTGWETHLGTSSVVANQAVLDGSGVTDANLITEINCEVGKRYEFKIDSFRSNGSNSYNINVSTGSGSLFHQTVIAGVNKSNTTMETTTIQFVATQETHYVGVKCNGNPSSAIITIDNAYVKQTGELITNGTFDNGTTGWTENNSILEIDSSTGDSRLKITDNGAAASAYQLIKTVAGKKYTATVIATSLDLADGRFEARDQSVTGTVLNSIDPINLIDDEVLTFNFIAASNDTVIVLGGGSDTGNVAYFDNISVRLAEDDRSVNNNGLQIFGEIDKTPVAPGADLVAYSGFSADNYLMQPYNPDLDFGTGDFSIITWVNKNSTATQVMLNSGDGSSSRLYLYISGTNELRFAAGGTGTNVYGSIGSDSIWNQITIVRKDGIVYGYINGVFQASYSNSDAVTHSSNGTLKIGSSTGGTYPFGGSLSLIRFTATSITPEQIAKIYRDEKALFTDGAQATLYGTSDAVTALAYDDKTELLHVGTASGRSDFAGLRRINNTTTAVTTSISASNNLIAEQ